MPSNPELTFEILQDESAVEQRPDNTWVHKVCGETLVAKTVVLSSRVRGFGGVAGDGSTATLQVPYCGECQPEPADHGTFDESGNITHPSIVPAKPQTE